MDYMLGVKMDELIATQYKIVELLNKIIEEEAKEAPKEKKEKEKE